GVGQHRAAQVGGPCARVDRSVESVLNQQRQVSAVIDVGMRKHYCGNLPAGKGKVLVSFLGLFPASLILPTIQEITLAVHCELMHGAGDSLGRTPEGEFHSLKNKTFLVSRPKRAFSPTDWR